MGLYGRYVLPRLIELAMRDKEMAHQRGRLVPQAEGRVVEVGVGSGLNLPFYGPKVERLWGVDPSLELQRYARERARGLPFPVEFLAHSAEEIPLESGSADTVVTTWTLCTVPRAEKALAEMRRVLKPGGRMLFCEHGRAPQPGLRRVQDWLNPLWRPLAGGCNLNREVDALIQGSGFRLEKLENFFLHGLRPMVYLYFGSARPG
jgi:ubiquinone/menaquinone biosynthesis C-methylase UbiE